MPGAAEPFTVIDARLRDTRPSGTTVVTGIPHRLVRSRDQQRLSAADDLRRDFRDLIGRLAETQHNLWKTLPNGSMVIDLGKPKIFKGLLTKRGKDLRMGGFDASPAFAQIFQKCD